MKTLTAHNRDIDARRTASRESEHAVNARKLETIDMMNIPEHVSADPNNRTNYRKQRMYSRDEIARNRGRWADVACDHCGVEMWRHPEVLASMPPQYSVTCPGCGFSGYVR